MEKSDDKVFVREKASPADRSKPSKGAPATATPERIVIVGGGAAGFAAAEMLRREGFGGSLTLVSADDEPPYDRPNCSKDYLAGSAPEDWIRSSRLSSTRNIQSTFNSAAKLPQLTPGRGKWRWRMDGRFHLTSSSWRPAPSRSVCNSGADQPHVHVLRSLSDARAIIANATAARHAVVIGASSSV